MRLAFSNGLCGYKIHLFTYCFASFLYCFSLAHLRSVSTPLCRKKFLEWLYLNIYVNKFICVCTYVHFRLEAVNKLTSADITLLSFAIIT